MDARTRVGFIETCRRVYNGEGAAGFYAGLPITLIRVIPNTCIVSYRELIVVVVSFPRDNISTRLLLISKTFVTYELFLRWAREKLDEFDR